jgi:hypothetical protein
LASLQKIYKKRTKRRRYAAVVELHQFQSEGCRSDSGQAVIHVNIACSSTGQNVRSMTLLEYSHIFFYMDEAVLAKNLMLDRKCEKCRIVRNTYLDFMDNWKKVNSELQKQGCVGCFKLSPDGIEYQFWGPAEGVCDSYNPLPNAK